MNSLCLLVCLLVCLLACLLVCLFVFGGVSALYCLLSYTCDVFIVVGTTSLLGRGVVEKEEHACRQAGTSIPPPPPPSRPRKKRLTTGSPPPPQINPFPPATTPRAGPAPYLPTFLTPPPPPPHTYPQPTTPYLPKFLTHTHNHPPPKKKQGGGGPFFVRALDVGRSTDDGQWVVVMEYLEHDAEAIDLDEPSNLYNLLYQVCGCRGVCFF